MADTKPTVTIPDTAPPADLVLEDIEVGTGTEAVAGANAVGEHITEQKVAGFWHRPSYRDRAPRAPGIDRGRAEAYYSIILNV